MCRRHARFVVTAEPQPDDALDGLLVEHVSVVSARTPVCSETSRCRRSASATALPLNGISGRNDTRPVFSSTSSGECPVLA
ncbi:hypothetical protein [Lentzea flava]|uniref:hypothetical protein n=1 Tax=Lentzea flava TaxID=103732 RepID=UPI00167133AF|nr:hypothetical protein [Lentzea flava]MCP2205369.1 hypothetical protein [Lentzea flava]